MNNNINQIVDELKEQEWITFTIDNSTNGVNTTLFIKSIFNNDSYSIIITNLSLVWFKHSDSNTTINDKNRFNPHLDSPIEKILTILKDSITEKKSDTAYRLSINNNTNNLVFTISTKISFYTFKWSFELDPIEKIINSDSRQSHAEFIKDHLIIPLMFCCKNQQISNQLLNKKLDRVLSISMSNNNSTSINNNNNNVNINNGGVATLSVSIGTGGRNHNNNHNNYNNNNKKQSTNNIYQTIISETQKPEDFSKNDFNFFNDPIFLQYYNHITVNNDKIDLNTTTIIDDSNNNTNTTTNTNNNNNNNTKSELSLFYDVESTPKKNYNNSNRSKNNNNSTINSLPSSLSFIPYSNSQTSSISSSSSFGFPQNLDDSFTTINENENNDNTNNNNNLKVQFEKQQTDPEELLLEKKRKLELEEKLEQSKQKQLNKKKKTKFV